MQHIYPTRKERIFNPDSLCHEVQTLTDFLRSNKIEVLNVAGPRESKEPGVYEWTLTLLRLLDRAATGAGPKSERVNRTIGRVGVGKGRVGESAAELLGQPAILD